MRVFSGLALAALAGVVLVALPARADQAVGDQPLTDKDKEKVGEKDLDAMRGVLSAIDKLVEQARNDKDTIRLVCINEQKTNATGLIKVGELALEDLRAAERDRQEEAVDHEYDKIHLAHDKVAEFKIQAEQCIGSLKFYDSNKTEVEVTVPADLPREDTISPAPLATTLFRPPPASPLR